MISMARVAASGLASLVLLGGAFATIGAIQAASRPEIRVTGDCSARSDWKLKVKAEDGGRLETDLQVDQNVVGSRWRVVLKNDGVQFFGGIRTTVAPSGAFSVERLSPDGPGKDVISATATNLSTGETCKASVAY